MVHWLGFLLDELLFRAYRRVEVRAPVFITGIPRSGTTFLHRSLAVDAQRFATVMTWEAVLAPSITERKVLRLLGRLDARLGGRVRQLVERSIEGSAGDFSAIHEVGLRAPEEDYLWLLPAASCFLLAFAFPFDDYLRRTARLDELSPPERQRLLAFYHRCIQRHLYASGAGRRFLSKNAAFASWAGALLEMYPDAVVLACVREPAGAVASQLSALRPARAAFASDPTGEYTAAIIMEMFAHNYHALAALSEAVPPARLAVLDQKELRSDARALIAAALVQVGIEPGTLITDALSKQPGQHRSGHRTEGTPALPRREEIEVCLQPAYTLIVNSRARVRASTSPYEAER
jgi:hypothetical protein